MKAAIVAGLFCLTTFAEIGGRRAVGAQVGLDSARPFFFALLMAGFLLVFMTGIFFLDARMTGWSALAQHFPAGSEPANISKRQNGGVGTIGLVQMRNLLRAAGTDTGLYLAFPKILSAGHPSLLIPWSQLRVTDDKTIFGIRVLTLQAGDPKIARVILRGGLAPEVAARLAASAT